MEKFKYPVWVYDPPAGSGGPFVGVVRNPDGTFITEAFGCREDAMAFTEKTVRDLIMAPAGKKRSA